MNTKQRILAAIIVVVSLGFLGCGSEQTPVPTSVPVPTNTATSIPIVPGRYKGANPDISFDITTSRIENLVIKIPWALETFCELGPFDPVNIGPDSSFSYTAVTTTNSSQTDVVINGHFDGQIFSGDYTVNACGPDLLNPGFTATWSAVSEDSSEKVSPVDGMTMVLIPQGDFQMGSPEGVGHDDEHPKHTVFLDSYWIDKTEVTNGMYEKCVAAGACTKPSDLSSRTRPTYYGNPEFSNYPVIYVNWDQAKAYCEWSGRSLPTEAQWEKAARSNGSTYPWGEQTPDETLTNMTMGEPDTAAVGSYPAGASPYGVLDMVGSLFEWVADWSSDTYYADSPDHNPTGPQSGDNKVTRGGSQIISLGYEFRVANRGSSETARADNSLGFRCVLPLEP